MPLCLTELPCIVAIYIYWVVSQLPCCTWLVPKSKLNDGWPVLGHSIIVQYNHLHKVGLDHSLKYQSAPLFFLLCFGVRASGRAPVVCHTNLSGTGSLSCLGKGGLLAAHQSPSLPDSSALVKWADRRLGGQSASLADGPECGQPAEPYMCVDVDNCMYGHNKEGSLQFEKRCRSERLSTKAASLKRDFCWTRGHVRVLRGRICAFLVALCLQFCRLCNKQRRLFSLLNLGTLVTSTGNVENDTSLQWISLQTTWSLLLAQILPTQLQVQLEISGNLCMPYFCFELHFKVWNTIVNKSCVEISCQYKMYQTFFAAHSFQNLLSS